MVPILLSALDACAATARTAFKLLIQALDCYVVPACKKGLCASSNHGRAGLRFVAIVSRRTQDKISAVHFRK
jgi:hypothetical protein